MNNAHTVRWIQPLSAPLNVSVAVPGSKSITNRALLMAAFATGTSRLSGVLQSDDTSVFTEAIQALGFHVSLDAEVGSCSVTGSGGGVPLPSASIWCGSAGTASRFLLAAVATARGVYQMDASAQMRSRPIGPLLESLTAQGSIITTSEGSFPLTLEAKGLRGGRIELGHGDESSQYLSSLLMAAPMAQSPMIIETDLSVSRPYVDMTIRMMEAFGVRVERNDYQRFSVVPGVYQARDYVVEADASTASYFFGAAAVSGGTVWVPKLRRGASLQGDLGLLSVLEQMGCVVEDGADSVRVTGPERLRGVCVDMGDISDTVMTLACVAPYADGPTTMERMGHIRLKESDRIMAVADGLQRMGIQSEIGEDFLRVFPGEPRGAVIETFDDHRIAMAFSIMGLVTPGVGISDPECVAKTCPEFYDLLSELY